MATGVKITGSFTTNNPQDTYGLLEDIYLIGSYRAVNTPSDRDAIPVERRKWGMLIGVVTDNKIYQLVDQGNGDLSDNSNWVEFSASGGQPSNPPTLNPVKAVSTTNITLNGLQTIDGVSLSDGDRVLVAGQSDSKENGIYIAKDGANWVRASDLAANVECAGKTVIVQEGTHNADTLWEFSSDPGSDVIGTDEIHLKLLSNGPASVANGLHEDSGFIKLGGDLTEYTGFNMSDGVYMSWLGNYVSNPSTQLSVDIYSGDNSSNAAGYFEVLLQDPNHFEYKSGIHISLDYTELGFSSGKIHIKSTQALLTGNANLWQLENPPDGSVSNAIATVGFIKGEIQSFTPTETTEKFTLTGSDISNGLTLEHTVDTDKHVFVFVNGLAIEEYTVSGNKINFTSDADVEVDDRVVVKYSY